MGEQLKEASFTLLVLLVAVSGVYEFCQTPDMAPVGIRLGVGAIQDFSSQNLVQDLNIMVVSGGNTISTLGHIVSTVALTEIPQFIGSIVSFFLAVWSIFLKLMFGWVGLLDAIFSSIGIANLSIVFKAPIAIIQIVACLYFLRDIVNTIRGAG